MPSTAASLIAIAAMIGSLDPRAVQAAPATTPSETEATTPSPSEVLPSTPTAEPGEPSTTTPTEPAPAEPTAPTAEPQLPASAPPIEAAPREPTPAPKPKPAVAASEPTASEPATLDLPPRLPPMQQAGWWTVFAGFAIGTVGGVLGGVAERQEDKATRLAVSFDLETGSQPLYADVRDDYQKALDRGRAAQKAGIALGVIGIAAVIAGVVVLAVDLKRRKQTSPRTTARRFELRLDRGLQARF